MFFLAQCVMCARNAAAQESARAAVLNGAILVIAAPALILLTAFAWLVYRRR